MDFKASHMHASHKHTCQPLIAAAETSPHNDTGLFFRQAAHILTWFVTSSVVGLYVVMPCVPTEKTRLYLEHRDESETHPTYDSAGSHMRSASSAEHRLGARRPLNMWGLSLSWDSETRVSSALCLFHCAKLAAAQWYEEKNSIYIAPCKLIMIQRQVINWWFQSDFFPAVYQNLHEVIHPYTVW